MVYCEFILGKAVTRGLIQIVLKSLEKFSLISVASKPGPAFLAWQNVRDVKVLSFFLSFCCLYLLLYLYCLQLTTSLFLLLQDPDGNVSS